MSLRWRVAFVTSYGLFYGGGETWLRSALSTLSEAGFELDVYVPNQYLKESSSFGCGGIHLIPFDSLYTRLLRRLKLENYVWPFLNVNLKKSYDCIYVMSCMPLNFVVHNAEKGRIVLGTHDFYISNKAVSKDLMIRPLMSLTYRILRKNLYVHSLNAFTTGFFSFLHDRVYEVGNYPFYYSKKVSLSDRFLILYMNVVNNRKGGHLLPALAQRFAEMRSAEFVVAGEDEIDIRSRLDSPSPDNSRYIGYVDEKDKERLLSKASLFLLLSDRESSPISVLEALTSGVPVVSAWKPIAGVLDEQFFSAGAVVQTARSPASIVEAVRHFYDRWNRDPQNYLEFRKKIQAVATARLNIETQLASIRRMFEEMSMGSSHSNVRPGVDKDGPRTRG